MSRRVNTRRYDGDYNVEKDEDPTGGIDQADRDYQGSSDTEGQGAVPADPPDNNPMPQQHIRKPKGPPKHNM